MGYKNLQKQSDYNCAWAKAHPKRTALNYKKWAATQKGHACQMHHRKAAWCRKYSVEYTLSRDWYLDHLNQGCELTGIQFEFRTGPYSASVDRIDPDKGYTVKNSRMIVFGLNALKGAGSDLDMYLIAEKLLKFKGDI